MRKFPIILLVIFLLGFNTTSRGQTYYSLSFDGSSYVNIDAAAWRDAGSAVDFDGSTSYATSTAAMDLSGSAITLEAWVYVNNFASGGTPISQIMGIEDAANSALLRFGDVGVDSNKVQFVLYFGSAQVKLTSTTGVSTGAWHHIAGTYDGSNMYIYIDGTQDGTQAQTGSFTANGNFYLASGYGARFLDGKIDEARVWSNARVDYAIKRGAYNQLASNDTSNLTAYYQMSDGSGTTITDNSTHSNSLTLTSGTWVSSTAPLGRIRNFTMECWVNIPSTSDKGCFLHLGPNDWGYGIGVGSSGTGGSFDAPGNQLILLSDITRWIPTGHDIGIGWHHVALVVDDGSNFIAYLDGLNVYTESTTTRVPWGLSASPIATIGGMPLTRKITGDIDEVRFWKEARNQQQIRDDLHFQIVGNEANLLAYYKMTDGSGTTLTDNSSNTYNGTISGATWADSLSCNNLVYGQGTSTDEYLMACLNNLSWLTQSTSKFGSYIKQTVNIDATNTQYWDDSDDNSDGDKYNDPNDLTATGNNEGFYPIGLSTNFTGNYNGDTHTISALKIFRGGTDKIGLFGLVSYGTISNLGVTGVNIVGNAYVGGLTGRGWHSTISNCYSTGSISGGDQIVGGLIGQTNGDTDANDNTITNCYSTASCSATYLVGGLIGTPTFTTVSNCYSSGDVTRSSGSAGGFGAFVGILYSNAVISNCYSTGSVFYTGATNPTDMGFVALNISGTFSNNFFDSEVSNQTTATGATAKTTAEMKRATTFLDGGWSFVKSAGHWAMNGSDNSGYPFLRFENYTPSQIWLGTGSTTWATTGNWSEEAKPTSAQNIIVPNVTNDPVIASTGETSNNFLIETGALMDISSAGNLTISGNLTNNGTFTINSDASGTGSLIIDGTATGDVAVERFLTHDRWHYIAEQTNISGNFNTLGMGLTGGANNDQFYRWEENLSWGGNIGNWVDILNGPDGNNSTMGSEGFTACKGYAINYISTDKTLSLSGVPYVANKTITLTKTTNSTGIGSNLVGNPFTSTLAINSNADGTNNFLHDNVATLDPNYSAIYLWNESSNWDGSSNADYVTINNSSAATFIQPGQAFMVMAANDGVTLNFKKATRKHGSATFYKNANSDNALGFELFIKDADNVGNSTSIVFLPKMTLGLDPGYDGGKLKGNPDIALYTRLVEDNGVDMGIQALPDNDIESIVVPVGVDVGEATMCEFSVNPEDMKEYPIYLEDRANNTITNLKQGSYSTLVSKSGIGRFYLHFKEVSGIESHATLTQLLQVWSSNNAININNSNSYLGDINVVNMFGQVLFSTNLNGDKNQKLDFNVSAGYYIVNIVTQQGVVNRKVYVK